MRQRPDVREDLLELSGRLDARGDGDAQGDHGGRDGRDGDGDGSADRADAAEAAAKRAGLRGGRAEAAPGDLRELRQLTQGGHDAPGEPGAAGVVVQVVQVRADLATDAAQFAHLRGRGGRAAAHGSDLPFQAAHLRFEGLHGGALVGEASGGGRGAFELGAGGGHVRADLGDALRVDVPRGLRQALHGPFEVRGLAAAGGQRGGHGTAVPFDALDAAQVRAEADLAPVVLALEVLEVATELGNGFRLGALGATGRFTGRAGLGVRQSLQGGGGLATAVAQGVEAGLLTLREGTEAAQAGDLRVDGGLQVAGGLLELRGVQDAVAQVGLQGTELRGVGVADARSAATGPVAAAPARAAAQAADPAFQGGQVRDLLPDLADDAFQGADVHPQQALQVGVQVPERGLHAVHLAAQLGRVGLHVDADRLGNGLQLRAGSVRERRQAGLRGGGDQREVDAGRSDVGHG